MKQNFQHEDVHLNPETIMVLNQIRKAKSRGATAAQIIYNLVILIVDDNGELNFTRTGLSEATGISASDVSKGIKELADAGLIEYRLSRTRSGSLIRLNPKAISVGAKYAHSYRKVADIETGEVLKKREVQKAEAFNRLCRRYNGNPLCAKKIAAEKAFVATLSTFVNVMVRT